MVALHPGPDHLQLPDPHGAGSRGRARDLARQGDRGGRSVGRLAIDAAPAPGRYGGDRASCLRHRPVRVTGKPVPSPADTLPGTLGTVSDANGAKQITYNGLPLYTFKGAKILSTKANGTAGQWHVIKLSVSDIKTG